MKRGFGYNIRRCNGKTECLEDYPELMELLKMPPSVEPRAFSLFVKDDKQAEFKAEFNKIFADSFRLMTNEEVFKEHLLGFGTPHPKAADFIGDFFAVALSNVNLDYKRGNFEPICVHAGLTEEEITVVFETKDR